jgi:hypothetical protein
MRPQLEEIRLLEDFLNGRLSESQCMEVEVRLLWDRNWQAALANQQTAYQALRLAGRQQLRRELKAIHAQLFG